MTLNSKAANEYSKILDKKAQIKITYDISPYPTVVMVTTAHQNPSGMDLKCDAGFPASAKYTVLENRTTPINNNKY